MSKTIIGTSPVNLAADCAADIDALIAANVPTATDDCSTPIVTEDSDTTVPGICAGDYVRTVVYSVADDCGNMNPATFEVIITVTDTNAQNEHVRIVDYLGDIPKAFFNSRLIKIKFVMNHI